MNPNNISISVPSRAMRSQAGVLDRYALTGTIRVIHKGRFVDNTKYQYEAIYDQDEDCIEVKLESI